MKKMFVIIFVSLTLSSSVLANKIFLSQSGFNFEIPNQFVQYNRDYLKDNMEKILSQADEAGLVRTEEFLLNQMTTLEEYENINQFVSENNVANSITFLLMENINTFTDEEIKKNRDEIIKKIAEQYQIDDDVFSTFEIFTLTNNYRASPKIIEIFVGGNYSLKWFTINRSTLKTNFGTTCKVVKFNIKDHLEKRSKQLLEKQKKENKI